MATCIYCGGQIPDSAKFCTNCGAALPVEAPIEQPAFDAASQQPGTFNPAAAQPYQDPSAGQQQPYQQQPYQQAYQQQPYGQAPAKSATMLIVLSVLEFLFCGGLLAIIPLVFAIQASSAYSAGNVELGDAKAKTAKTALIIILIVGLCAYFALFGVGACSVMGS